MACDGSSETDVSVAFERLSITSSDRRSSQIKNNIENPLQSHILSAMHKITKSKNRDDIKGTSNY